MFATLDLNRREALWQAKAIASAQPLPLFAHTLEGEAIIGRTLLPCCGTG